MTRQEAIPTLAMIADNWTFLKTLREVESSSFEIYYTALAQYPVEEVQQGIRDAIRELKKTPVVADLVEYVENVRRRDRRRAEDVNAQQAWTNAVRCTECNDHGYVTIVYPSGDEALRPCTCEAGRTRFGKKVFEGLDRLPKWKSDLYFEGKRPEEHKLIRVTRRIVKTGKHEIWHGSELIGSEVVYVPYRPSGRPKEEVYKMWVERSKR